MKAYRDPNGKVTLFRPDMNMKRMNNSARRVALPVSVSSWVAPPERMCINLDDRRLMAIRYWNAWKNLSASTKIGYPKNQDIVYTFDQHSVSQLHLYLYLCDYLHILFDSRHTSSDWCFPSLWRTALCDLLSCRSILPAGFQTRGIIWHYGVYPCGAWRYGSILIYGSLLMNCSMD
jgi:hypothetical protein